MDASALVKLVLPEPESDAVAALLANAERHVTSIVSTIEVPRAAARASANPDVQERAERVLAVVDIRALDVDVRQRAVHVLPRKVRALDAIHLASALSLGEALSGFVAYDRLLQAAASEAGLAVLAPS